MSQKLPVNGFKWIKKLSKFNEHSYAEDFIKNYNKTSNKGYILEEDVEYPKNLFNLHSDLSFLAARKKTENVISLFAANMIKKTMLFTSIKSQINTKKSK